ncbi:MAG: hypothetical protein O3A28_09455 [Actinomycetota bacterium]|nr:hypothetical protein [Actinomycetota bacterium]MDA3007682.1 hypothetical protein [Actinomycetota bacterium]MDA3035238.1 hypothetical protein [Actinomycetota bacterium]
MTALDSSELHPSDSAAPAGPTPGERARSVRDRGIVIARMLAGRRSDWRLHRVPSFAAPQPGRHWAGPIVVVGSILVGWFAFDDAVGDGNVGFALFIGAASIVMMAWSFLLALRLQANETLFGGLDRAYRWHRWLGALSVPAMWLHIQMVDDVKGIAGASKDIADAAEDLAEQAETIIYFLIAASLLRWLPTRWWRWTHKTFGIPFAFASWHFYTATKPYANDSAWGIWFTAIMCIGLIAWFGRVVVRDAISGHRYRVSDVQRHGSNTTVDLVPRGRGLDAAPGQFAFVRFNAPGLREPHPFTIASCPGNDVVRFHIRDLGDWTSRLGRELTVGTTARLEGPYGRLGPVPSPGTRALWVAGGVGITPFLSALDAADAATPPVLLYTFRSAEDAAGNDTATSRASTSAPGWAPICPCHSTTPPWRCARQSAAGESSRRPSTGTTDGFTDVTLAAWNMSASYVVRHRCTGQHRCGNKAAGSRLATPLGTRCTAEGFCS